MMKKDYDLIRKTWGFVISSINDQVVHFTTHILARKIMRKCQVDEVTRPVV